MWDDSLASHGASVITVNEQMQQLQAEGEKKKGIQSLKSLRDKDMELLKRQATKIVCLVI